ncbi:MAG: ATP-binding protein [Sodaliphilus sp.]
MIDRLITSNIEADFHKGKVIVVLGPRQVGKTTLLREIAAQHNATFYNCDDEDVREMLTGASSTELAQWLSNKKFVVIDEAQRVENVGMILKKIADLKLPTQVIVTGSSSLDLNDKINEAATGRLFHHYLFQFSTAELMAHNGMLEERRMLENRLIYGMYPDVVTHFGDAERLLRELSNSYLYRDLLSYQGIRKPDMLQKIVVALALQVGNVVSYSEIAKMVGVNRATIETYIDLLEKAFVVFRLSAFSRNPRNEITKGKKIYFYDTGVRNALIHNYAPLNVRTDTGALWENFIISERRKTLTYQQRDAGLYFWRSNNQSEIDLIEEYQGQIKAYEFKWNEKRRAKVPPSFIHTYGDVPFKVVTPANYLDFLKE